MTSYNKSTNFPPPKTRTLSVVQAKATRKKQLAAVRARRRAIYKRLRQK